MKCPICGAENPEGKNFCGDCGGTLDEIAVTSIGSQTRDYVKYGSSDDLFVWGATTHMTKQQYFLRMAIVIPMLVFAALVLIGLGHPFAGILFLLTLLGLIYVLWWIGRENAEWENRGRPKKV
jgi:uncharacterized membrane protein YvbJ